MLRSETFITASITCVEVMGDDMGAMRAIPLGFGLQPLSECLGTAAPPAAPPVDYPAYPEGLYQSAAPEFFDLVAGRSWTRTFGADRAQREAALAGLRDAVELMEQIQSGQVDLRSGAASPPYGTRQMMTTRYVHRAFGVWTGIFGNVAEQAAYRGWRSDSDGGPIDASQHNYKVTITADDQAQVRFFWSVTMYMLPEPFLYPNPQDKYEISSRAPDLVYNPNGSLTLYLRHHSPAISSNRTGYRHPPGHSWQACACTASAPRSRTINGKCPHWKRRTDRRNGREPLTTTLGQVCPGPRLHSARPRHVRSRAQGRELITPGGSIRPSAAGAGELLKPEGFRRRLASGTTDVLPTYFEAAFWRRSTSLVRRGQGCSSGNSRSVSYCMLYGGLPFEA